MPVIEGMKPVCLQKIDREYDCRHRPCDRVRRVDDFYMMEQMQRRCNIDDTEDAPAPEHYEHRDRSFAGTSQNAGDAVRQGQTAVEERLDMRLTRSECDDFRRGIEQRYKKRRSKEDEYSDELRHCYRTEYAEPRSGLSSIILLRTEVLAYERRQPEREARARHALRETAARRNGRGYRALQ